MKRLILLLAGCLFLFSCSLSTSSTQENTQNADLLIVMERSGCFGTCPIYNLTIHADGNVEYEGVDFVTIKGKQDASINSEQIKELVKSINDADFFSLEDKYYAQVTDMPSITLSITLNGRSKSVWHYGPLDCFSFGENAPQKLCDLENKIDKVVNSEQWIK
ncbi:MAG: hypothetical protein JNM55_04990 [Anaerolineales bacterium]|nr:hypothetical protein [Anaerolineales bacterium]